ncbi:ribonuclease HII [Fibrobacter sp. UWB4]|uniref:ribonuclease HII n=1 Tax=Fibrobacter sp. UWB4 TaxID=1964356 RepID=UPI000B52326C|nr:ribonuclease HII [Fibrobacter sp. UWB4]OWV16506.1 ribonuclease HII [Fibrobacter sp. UWB4]
MKFKLPAFLENIESPVEGEVALRRFAANPLAFGGDLDLFSAGANGALSGNASENSAIVVGIDEVGRGPLAGPVVACAAVLKSPDALLTLNDSKKLSRPKREAMFDAVKDACACYAIASASVEEIDEINILEADFLAMRRALQALGFPGLNETAPEIPIEVKGSLKDAANVILNEAQRNEGSSNGFPNILIAVDGNLKIRGVPAEKQMPIVKGDGRIASISAASILAKVFRDRYMDKLEELYPGYGFDKHAGYGTKAHLDAIRRQGFTPAHRKSFHPKSL